MKFNPKKLSIIDQPDTPFIDPDELWNYINKTKSDAIHVREIIAKSLEKNRLTLEETALLINANQPGLIEEIKEGARELKKKVYGNRIVLFAPLYVGNRCSNNCLYCGFKASNKDAIRKTLNDEELIKEVEALEDNGHKRLILVYGEHKDYSSEFIAHSVGIVYSVKKGNGEIRRVNINAAPLDIEGFRTVKSAKIGTYQIFQETYNQEAYKFYHPLVLDNRLLDNRLLEKGIKSNSLKSINLKSNYDWRLTSLDRAMQAGIDDVGIGALFGLYDWRFEVLGLIRHTNHLEACYNVGPHTISFPRLQSASNSVFSNQSSVKGNLITDNYLVNDNEFLRIIAILRLAVPYTGMILTAREPARIRDVAIQFGVSQIDAGTHIELGEYSHSQISNLKSQNLNREQFQINDSRTLNEIIDELIDNSYIPSFCTACYRKGRTGEHFMEFSVPGFIKSYCTPNAILTLAEYLRDYASPASALNGWKLIDNEVKRLMIQEPLSENQKSQNKLAEMLLTKLNQIKEGQSDLYF